MKERLKYYLRGLGTGILVTMILMMVSNANAAQSTVNDNHKEDVEEEYSVEETKEAEESIAVIERDKETTVTESVEEEQKQQMEQEGVIEEVSSMEENVAEEASDNSSSVTEASNIEESASAQEESSSEQLQENIDDAGQQKVDAAVTIQVVKGDGSGTVARKLQNAGLIDNASEFDAYLMQHGYDKRIRIGTVKIEAGSTWMEIADKLAGK